MDKLLLVASIMMAAEQDAARAMHASPCLASASEADTDDPELGSHAPRPRAQQRGRPRTPYARSSPRSGVCSPTSPAAAGIALVSSPAASAVERLRRSPGPQGSMPNSRQTTPQHQALLSAALSERQRKSVVFNGLALGDVVRITSPTPELDGQLATIESIPVYPNTWREVKLQSTGQVVKLRSSNILQLAVAV